MKANELRIGNLVKTDNSTKNYTDIEIVDLEILKEIFNGSEFYNPIPLTEEWLLKFGFAKQCDYLYFDFENGNISFNDEIKKGISLCIGTYCSSGLAFENIKHVHQLQNLFFALTGEELKLIN